MPSSSADSRGDDIKLEVRFVNMGLGGMRPAASNEFLAILSGELVIDLAAGDCWRKLSWVADLPSIRLPVEGLVPIGDGERSLRAPTPKNPPFAPTSLSCLALKKSAAAFGTAGTGMDSSGVGGIWLKRGCIDLGRLVRSSSTCGFKPSPTFWSGGCSSSDAESCDRERKYSDLPWTIKGLSSVSGGSRLILRPCFVPSSSCLASRRLCKAKASSGESSGGASPATWRRGDRKGRETEACDFDLMSRKSGRGCGMATLATLDEGSVQHNVSRVAANAMS